VILNIRPMPTRQGVGFYSVERQTELKLPYREEENGPAWVYHFTPQAWTWPKPDKVEPPKDVIIDAFSPNLNKSLHVGHLRQLALAACLKNTLSSYTKFVSMLGTTGLLKKSVDELQEWFDFIGFRPTLYYDSLMPQDADIVPRHEGEGEQIGALVWDGPRGPVIVFRKSDESCYRRSTYEFHDLAFAVTVGPDYYVTGAEQVEHFQRLGLEKKHLPMGLVLDSDGRKLKSRTGDALTAREAFEAVQAVLQPVPDPKKVVWNIVVWNFLATGRATNVKFNPSQWVKQDAPGMYCSYAWARLDSALGGAFRGERGQMTDEDVKLAGFAQYRHYHREKTRETMDPAPMANYLYELCRRVTKAYHAERIRDGRPGFQFAISEAYLGITEVMTWLGMFPVLLRED
jgi:hypothetical protein